MNGMKEHAVCYDMSADECYFQYTTVSLLLPRQRLILNFVYLFAAWMDDVELDGSCFGGQSTSYRIRRLTVPPRRPRLPEIHKRPRVSQQLVLLLDTPTRNLTLLSE